MLKRFPNEKILGQELKIVSSTLTEAFSIAIQAYKTGYEVDVINTNTGEVILALRDNDAPYIADCVHEVI